MLIHPQFDPVAIHLGPFAVHWYGLMYLVGFLGFLWLGNRRAEHHAFMTRKRVDDFLMYGVLGVVLGGRFGYVLFYKPGEYLAHPLQILHVWEGGMSFHGGFIGVLVAMALFARSLKRGFFEVADFVAPLVPLGLAAGRLGNFINGELWGRVTDPNAPWAMLFPSARADDIAYASQHPQWLTVLTQYGGLPRHPSQLYELALEGIVLFSLLWWYSSKPRRIGAVSAVFLLGYGLARFTCEFGREPDNFLGLLTANLSMGQWLSLPMIVAGIALWAWSRRQPQAVAAQQS
jgi:phosphatidylglycerol:prolipoprotein diacylglycerol transferase